jgi:myo-inositol 2-dehydrogenase/D-chiro-inositol 1-dehydrogenase
MNRYSTANRLAWNGLRSAEFGPCISLLGGYMTAPTYFLDNPDYTGFFLHRCVHTMDLVAWLMNEPVTLVRTRRFEPVPGRLVLHVAFEFALGALATVVCATHQSRGAPMEWWQVTGDHRRVEIRSCKRCATAALSRSRWAMRRQRSIRARMPWCRSRT